MTRLRRLLPVLLTAALLLAACGDGGDGDGDLQVLDARSRMSPMLTGVGAVYLDIANTTEVDDTLLGGEVDPSVAARVEIHETFDADAEGGEGMDDMDDADDAMGDMDDDAMDEADDDATGGSDGDGMDDDATGGSDGDGMDDDAMGDDAMGDGDGDGFAMMGMRELEELPVPAGSTVLLVPGGNHLMLIDLAEDLVPGTEFDLTLTFAEAGEVTVTVEVREDV